MVPKWSRLVAPIPQAPRDYAEVGECSFTFYPLLKRTDSGNLNGLWHPFRDASCRSRPGARDRLPGPFRLDYLDKRVDEMSYLSNDFSKVRWQIVGVGLVAAPSPPFRLSHHRHARERCRDR